MDAYDKEILDIIQSNFPLDPRPYAVVGEAVGLPEAEGLAGGAAEIGGGAPPHGGQFRLAPLAGKAPSAGPRCPRTSLTPSCPKSTATPA
jgi:hypothetical protein